MSYPTLMAPITGPTMIDYSDSPCPAPIPLTLAQYPSEQSRTEIELRSRLNLTILSRLKDLAHELLPGAHQHNRRVSNGPLTVYLDHEVGPNFPEGHINPGFWSSQINTPVGSLITYVGHSVIDLLATIRTIDAEVAEKHLVSWLDIPSPSALKDWKPRELIWDSKPLINVQPPSYQFSPQSPHRFYPSTVGTANLWALQSLTTTGPQIRYLSRWRRASDLNSHWVEALPQEGLPLFLGNQWFVSSDDPVWIVPSEFDARLSAFIVGQQFVAVPGGAGNLNRTDLSFLAGRAVHLELLPHELRFTPEIEAALHGSHARDVTLTIIGDAEDPFPLSRLREIATRRGADLPPLTLPAPRLSTTALLAAGTPLPSTDLKRPAILAPILYEGGLGWFYAPEKLGKTWLALTLAHTVATGGSFGPWQAPEPRKVLFIDGEMHPDDLNAAMAAISRDHGGGESVPFSALCAKLTPSGRINLLDPEWRKEITRITQGLDLLILDNFYSLTNNVAGEFQEVLDFLQELRAKGTAILVIDHTNREGVLQGAHTKERAAETIIELRVPEGQHGREKVRAIEVTKSRHDIPEAAEYFTGTMAFTPETFRFKVDTPEVSAEPEPVPDDIAKLAPIVIAHDIDGLGFLKIQERLGIKKSTASDWYRKAKNLKGADLETLERELQRLLDARKAAE